MRRLVSEGTRLRLPWAGRVAWLDAHPERVLELLDLLKDDPSTLVRRSVANNLNDLGKTHPKLLYRTCAAWLRGASPERRALVEHALRSAVKRGEAEALRLLGYGGKAAVDVENVRFDPPRVAIGGRVVMTFALRSRSRAAAGRPRGRGRSLREGPRSRRAEGVQDRPPHPAAAGRGAAAGDVLPRRAHDARAASRAFTRWT